jgi:hypothetical protein
MALTARREPEAEYGPAMKSLPNARWRAFVEFYLMEKPSRAGMFSNAAAAARRAGFGTPKSSTRAMAHIGWRKLADARIQEAIAEESRKLLRSGHPEAVKALQSMISDPAHPGHARAVGMLLDRCHPIESRQQIEVTHKIVDPDTEALEELRALRALNTPHDKMLEVFGVNGMDRLLALEAADQVRRADAAKVIDGEVLPPADEELAWDAA